MENNIQFLDFELANDGKCAGYAAILFNGVTLSFRVNYSKDGQSIFFNPGAWKKTENGQDYYTPWFMIDSRYTNETINKMLRKHVEPLIFNQTSQSEGQAVWSPTQQVAPQYAQAAQAQPQAASIKNDDLPF